MNNHEDRSAASVYCIFRLFQPAREQGGLSKKARGAVYKAGGGGINVAIIERKRVHLLF